MLLVLHVGNKINIEERKERNLDSQRGAEVAENLWFDEDGLVFEITYLEGTGCLIVYVGE